MWDHKRRENGREGARDGLELGVGEVLDEDVGKEIAELSFSHKHKQKC
jgi:hypothetical protein